MDLMVSMGGLAGSMASVLTRLDGVSLDCSRSNRHTSVV